jgi:hypothetical protein
VAIRALRPQHLGLIASYLYAIHEERGTLNTWIREGYQSCQRVMKEMCAEDYTRFGQDLLRASRQEQEICFPDCQADAAFLMRSGVDPQFVETLLLSYCRLHPDVYVAVLLPRGASQAPTVLESLDKLGDTLYVKQVRLQNRGPSNYVRHAYDYLCTTPHHWVRDPIKAQRQVAQRFTNDEPLHLMIFQTQDWRSVRPWKLEVRRLYGMGTRALHATDTHRESVELAELYLNPNTIHFMNHAQDSDGERLGTMVKALKKLAAEREEPLHNYCLEGNSVLEAYGLADHEGDYLAYHIEEGEPSDADREFMAWLADPRHTFTYRGLPCCTLNHLNSNQARPGLRIVRLSRLEDLLKPEL